MLVTHARRCGACLARYWPSARRSAGHRPSTEFAAIPHASFELRGGPHIEGVFAIRDPRLEQIDNGLFTQFCYHAGSLSRASIASYSRLLRLSLYWPLIPRDLVALDAAITPRLEFGIGVLALYHLEAVLREDAQHLCPKAQIILPSISD